MSWKREFEKKLKLWFCFTSVGIEGDDESIDDIKSFIQSQKDKSFKEGRESVLKEFKVEHDKMMQGFSYRKVVKKLGDEAK